MVAAAPAITSLIQVKTARGTGRRAPILPLGKISQNFHADVCLPFPGQNLSPQPHLAAGEAGTCTLLTTETVEGSVGAKENVDVCRRRHSRLRLAFSQRVFLGCFDEHLVNAGVTVKYPPVTEDKPCPAPRAGSRGGSRAHSASLQSLTPYMLDCETARSRGAQVKGTWAAGVGGACRTRGRGSPRLEGGPSALSGRWSPAYPCPCWVPVLCFAPDGSAVLRSSPIHTPHRPTS